MTRKGQTRRCILRYMAERIGIALIVIAAISGLVYCLYIGVEWFKANASDVVKLVSVIITSAVLMVVGPATCLGIELFRLYHAARARCDRGES